MDTNGTMMQKGRPRTPSLTNSEGTVATASSTASSPTVSTVPSTEFSRPETSQSSHRRRQAFAMEHPSQSPPPPQSLPPSFITQFVRSSFVEALCDVDFTQALKSLDYLKILDDRRKRELCAALRRLNIDTSTYDQQKRDTVAKLPALYEWVAAVEDKSRRAEALYTQVYIGLRRWVSAVH